jgi:hypothetical protein
MALERSQRQDLPEEGAVGGVDIGWSPVRRTSAAARLYWDANEISLPVRRFRAVEIERNSVLEEVFDRPLLAVAFDGPLTTGLLPADRYRFAERMLTSGFQPLIGKPGQSSSPNGRKLNKYASDCALSQVARRIVSDATHAHNIHHLAVVEAFPTSFLGVMASDPVGHKTKRKKTSDVFFELLARDGTLSRLFSELLPGRKMRFEFSNVADHDERAALICAITALCVAAKDYTAVGDHDGWIILPPFLFIQAWALPLFEANARKHAAYRVSRRVQMGLAQGMYPPMTLEDLNSTDPEIVQMFYGDAGWEPAQRRE